MPPGLTCRKKPEKDRMIKKARTFGSPRGTLVGINIFGTALFRTTQLYSLGLAYTLSNLILFLHQSTNYILQPDCVYEFGGIF